MNVALLGFGTVGSGVADMLTQNKDVLYARAKAPVDLKYILDIRDFPNSPYEKLFVKDFSVIEADPSVDVVVEVIGGATKAYEFTKRALLAGKSVVSSNKELVATHGTELLAIAKEKGVYYLFEAAVGGGIPALSPLVDDLSHNRISEVSGILNGTTNYILTQMFTQGAPFSAALAEAQAKGYAEKDPTADIEGIDVCRKIAILAALAFGAMVPAAAIHTEGITAIRKEDVAAAEKIGCSIKLLGRAIKENDGDLYIMVAPFLIPKSLPLAEISGVYNGVLIRGNFVGDVMLYGRGAGSYPTASAVVADVDHIARGTVARPAWTDAKEGTPSDFSSFFCRHYVVAEGAEQSAIGIIFGEIEPISGEENAFLTPMLSESNWESCKERFAACGGKIVSHIRLY